MIVLPDPKKQNGTKKVAALLVFDPQWTEKEVRHWLRSITTNVTGDNGGKVKVQAVSTIEASWGPPVIYQP